MRVAMLGASYTPYRRGVSYMGDDAALNTFVYNAAKSLGLAKDVTGTTVTSTGASSGSKPDYTPYIIGGGILVLATTLIIASSKK